MYSIKLSIKEHNLRSVCVSVNSDVLGFFKSLGKQVPSNSIGHMDAYKG